MTNIKYVMIFSIVVSHPILSIGADFRKFQWVHATIPPLFLSFLFPSPPFLPSLPSHFLSPSLPLPAPFPPLPLEVGP